MLTWKEVIRADHPVWYTDEATGKPRVLEPTLEMIQHWHDSGKAMIASGLSIPVPLEHDKSVVAMSVADRNADRLRNNAGEVKDYAIRHGDRLYAQVDIQDEEIARKIPRTIKFASPYFNSFMDGAGKQWDGVITHLALTSRPRLHKQEPFQSIAAALSLAQPLKVEGTPKGVFLSPAGRLDRLPNNQGLVPHYPMAFSVLSGITLAEGFDGPPKKKEGEGKKPPPREGGEKKPPTKEGGDKELPFEEGAGAGGEGGGLDNGMGGEDFMPEEPEMEMVDVLCEMASALWGIDLPEGTDEKNLLQRLLRAMMDKLKADKGNEVMPEEDEMADLENTATTPPPVQKPKPKPVVQEQPPVFMSLEQVNALPEGDMKRMATAMLSMQAQTESLKKNVFDSARQRRQVRIERLAKRVGREGYKEELLAEAAGVQLSLGDDGAVVDPFDRTLSLLEKGLKDLPALVKRSTDVDEIDHPEEAGRMSEERRKAVLAEFLQNTGIPAA